MKPLYTLLSGFVISSFLAACNLTPGQSPAQPNDASPVPPPTLTSDPIKTPRPTVTPIPGPKQRPTFTNIPSSTLGSTFTPRPTSTPLPTGLIDTPTGSWTRPPGFATQATATPIGLDCSLIATNITWGMEIKPRTDFVVTWQVRNTGRDRWNREDFIFQYVEGDKMHKADRAEEFIPGTVYPRDKIKLQMRMISPKQPGFYSTTWGLRKSNKKEPFCTFSIAINVIKK